MKNKMLDLLNEEKMYAILTCKDSKIVKSGSDFMITDEESKDYMFDTYIEENELDRTDYYVRPVEFTNEPSMYRCFACISSGAFVYKEEEYDTLCITDYEETDPDYLIDTLTLDCFYKDDSCRMIMSAFLELV